MQSNTFKTSRLSLARLIAADVPFIFELVNSEAWIRFIGNRNISTSGEAAIYVQELMYNPAIRYLVVKLSASQIPVGIITIIKRSYLDHADLGFAFLPQYTGFGYAYEAAQPVLNDLLGRPEHQTVLATTLKENATSIKLLQKLGFRFDKNIQMENETLMLFSITAQA